MSIWMALHWYGFDDGFLDIWEKTGLSYVAYTRMLYESSYDWDDEIEHNFMSTEAYILNEYNVFDEYIDNQFSPDRTALANEEYDKVWERMEKMNLYRVIENEILNGDPILCSVDYYDRDDIYIEGENDGSSHMITIIGYIINENERDSDNKMKLVIRDSGYCPCVIIPLSELKTRIKEGSMILLEDP